MKSSGKYPITGKTEVDETVFGGQGSGVKGRQNKKKSLLLLALKKKEWSR